MYIDIKEAAADWVAEKIMAIISGKPELLSMLKRLKRYDSATFKHSVNVATLSMLIAKDMGMPETEISEIGVSGILHDIGKYMIPLNVLNKPGKFSPEEYNIMKHHSIYGYQMIENSDLSSGVKAGVLQHHERIDGTGYPYGYATTEIHLYAKIIAVADVYDALMSKRSYKDHWGKIQALRAMMQMTGGLDLEIVQALIRVTAGIYSDCLMAS